MIKKILKAIFLSDKRKNNRSSMGHIKDLLFFSQGKSFKVANISSSGLAIVNTGQVKWVEGQDFHGDIEWAMQEKSRLKGKVVRVNEKHVGLELSESPKEFRDILSKLSKK